MKRLVGRHSSTADGCGSKVKRCRKLQIVNRNRIRFSKYLLVILSFWFMWISMYELGVPKLLPGILYDLSRLLAYISGRSLLAWLARSQHTFIDHVKDWLGQVVGWTNIFFELNVYTVYSFEGFTSSVVEVAVRISGKSQPLDLQLTLAAVLFHRPPIASDPRGYLTYDAAERPDVRVLSGR